MLAEVWLWLLAALRHIDTAAAAEAAAAAAAQSHGSCKRHAHEQRVEAGAQRPGISSCTVAPRSLAHLVHRPHQFIACLLGGRCRLLQAVSKLQSHQSNHWHMLTASSGLTSGAQYAGSAAGWAPVGGAGGQAQHEQPANCAPAKPASFTVYLPLLRLSLRAMGAGEALPERLKLGDEKLDDLPAGLAIWLSAAVHGHVRSAAVPLRISCSWLPVHNFPTLITVRLVYRAGCEANCEVSVAPHTCRLLACQDGAGGGAVQQPGAQVEASERDAARVTERQRQRHLLEEGARWALGHAARVLHPLLEVRQPAAIGVLRRHRQVPGSQEHLLLHCRLRMSAAGCGRLNHEHEHAVHIKITSYHMRPWHVQSGKLLTTERTCSCTMFG